LLSSAPTPVPFATSGPVSSRRHAAVFAGLLLLVGLAYGNCLGNELVWDRYLIVSNTLIRDLRNIPLFFVNDYWAGTDQPFGYTRYRPLVVTTFALNYAVGGLNPFGYYLVNVGLHFAVTWLVYLLGLEIGLSFLGSAVAAALYAVHPMHTEVILAIGNRTELMMALGVLLSLWCSLRGNRLRSLAAFILALLSKEQAAIMPALLVTMDVALRRVAWPTRSWQQHLRDLTARYGAYLVLLAGYMVWRLWLFGRFQPPSYLFHINPLENISGQVWFWSVLSHAGHYLRLWLWPITLRTDYSFETIPLAYSIWNGGVFWAILAWGGLLVLGLTAFRRDGRISFVVGLTAVAFLPGSNFLVSVGTPVGERLFYLPSVGLCLLVGIGLSLLAVRSTSRVFSTWPLRVAVLLLAIMCLVFLARTMMRIQDWSSDEQFARSMVRDSPRSAKAHVFLGDFLENSSRPQDWAEALTEYQTAMAIYPDYLGTDGLLGDSLGFLFMKMGRWDEAASVLVQATQLNPRWSVPYYHLGRVYALQGNGAKADVAFRRSLELQDDPEARTMYSRFLIEQGRLMEALAEAEHVVERRHDYVLALYSRALALDGLDRENEAEMAYRSVLSMELPSYAREEIHRRLARLRAKGGR